MPVLESKVNAFGGVMVDPGALPESPEAFLSFLKPSLDEWTQQGLKVVWLEVPIARALLIPLAVDAGFVFHHAAENYLMLTYRLLAGAFVPPYASHYIGAGGVVLNNKQELLVVWERLHRHDGRRFYKLPGGALQPHEHLVDGVIREVLEETGIQTRFESLVCFRHWHGYRFGKSDIYFVCRLEPLSEQILMQEDEIAECLWMPVQEYLDSEYVGVFNRRIVQAALDGRNHLVPTWIDGYQTEPAEREIFMPKEQER